MSLESDLQEISGVGEATADKIMQVVESHDTDGVDTDEVHKALDFLDRGKPRIAESVLRDALED